MSERRLSREIGGMGGESDEGGAWSVDTLLSVDGVGKGEGSSSLRTPAESSPSDAGSILALRQPQRGKLHWRGMSEVQDATEGKY
jgi:hypothetical protein